MDIETAVLNGWREEIKKDLLESLAEYTKLYTSIVTEGWLTAGDTELHYKVLADGESLMAEIYESEDAFHDEEEPIKSFQIHLYVHEGPR